METMEMASTNGDLHTRRIKQEINDNNLDSAPVKVRKRRPRFTDQYDLDIMKSGLHDKGNQLSTVWNELYNLLGDYQAKLLSREGEFLASKAKYEGVTDMDQLRNDLIAKDNEVKELKERLNIMESRSETIQLDLSVKNSLLKKYQQDLLDKEASLLNLQSSNKKLENRVQALEVKLEGATLSIVGQQESPQPGTSGITRQITPPQLKRRGVPQQHSVTKRRPLAPAGQTQPVVCVEVEDSDEVRDVNQSLNQSVNDDVNLPLYTEDWTEQEEQEHQDENSNQTVFPGEENEEGGHQWPSQETSSEQDSSLMSQMESPANKSFTVDLMTCQYCCRVFTQKSTLTRHMRTIHFKIHPYHCPFCTKAFGQRSHLNAHVISRHGDVCASNLGNHHHHNGPRSDVTTSDDFGHNNSGWQGDVIGRHSDGGLHTDVGGQSEGRKVDAVVKSELIDSEFEDTFYVRPMETVFPTLGAIPDP